MRSPEITVGPSESIKRRLIKLRNLFEPRMQNLDFVPQAQQQIREALKSLPVLSQRVMEYKLGIDLPHPYGNQEMWIVFEKEGSFAHYSKFREFTQRVMQDFFSNHPEISKMVENLPSFSENYKRTYRRGR